MSTGAKPPRTALGAAVLALGLALALASSSGRADEAFPTLRSGSTAAPASLAAPGYVADAVCAQCHRDLAESYREVGMSRSFYRPSRDKIIEDFDNGRFYHPRSGRHYEMRESDGRFFLKRYRLGPDGKVRDVLEREIHWILGSGSNARTYIHQTEWGELYQLPISWYTRAGRWGMAPGYDVADHQGFNRRIQRDCMFCHNAYPQVPRGADEHGALQTFPHELPEGLGCQRCHGPGEAHVQASLNVDALAGQVRDSIWNPGRLAPAERDAVCMQCHLQPSVTLSGVRRFGRAMYAYRPDQPLDEYVVPMDVVEERPREERFEINHHPYRLRQSRCYEASAGALGCLTCHDPHRKVRGAETVKTHYRDACLSCHAVEACGLEEMVDRQGLPAVAADNCVACHMPRRRTQDVIQVTMTDHRIGIYPEIAELTAPLDNETEHRVETVVVHDPETDAAEAEVYRALAMVRAGSVAAIDRLAAALERAAVDDVTPYLELATGELAAGRFAAAEKTLAKVLERAPGEVLGHLHLGVALASQGKLEPAARHLRRAYELDPERPEVRFNLGLLLVQAGQLEPAIEHFKAAVDKRPNLAAGWFELGNAYARGGRYAEALGPYREALAHEPEHAKARQNLIESLHRLGRQAEVRDELAAWVHFEPENELARRWLTAVRAEGENPPYRGADTIE